MTITVTDAVGATSTQNNSLTVVGSFDQTIITAAIPPHGFRTPPVLIGSGAPGTHNAYFILEDGSHFLLEDGTSLFLLESDNAVPVTGNVTYQTEDGAILFAEDGTPLLIEQDIAGPTIQPAGIASTVTFGALAINQLVFPTIFAVGLASTVAFGNPTLNGVGLNNIFPTGRPSTITFGNPTVTIPGVAFPITIRPLGFRTGPNVVTTGTGDLDTPLDLDTPVDLDSGGTTTTQQGIQFGIPTLKGVRKPIKIGLPTTDDILDGLLPVRADSFEFELIDVAGIHLGYLDVGSDVAATMRFDTARTSFRTLSGVEVFRADLSQIDVEHERLKVTMILQNGARFPLGILMFGQDNRAPASWGTKFTPELFDEVFLIDQDLDTTVSAPIGASVYDLIIVLLAPFKYEILVDLPDVNVAAPLVFQVGSSRYAALKAAAGLLGCFAPYFDNEHRFRFKSARLSGDTTVDHTYRSGLRIIEEQMQLQNSSYKAPNRYIVANGDPVNPVVGIYDLPPSAPHSAFSRDGRIVTTSRTAQGLLTTEAARQAAYVDAITDRTSYGRITFAATADPRHDGFDTMDIIGTRYLETAWTLELVSGGLHTHEGTQLWGT